MPAAIAFYDWLIAENNVGLVPASIFIQDNSTGGTASGSLTTLQKEQSDVLYSRVNIDRTSSQTFIIDIRSNGTAGGEQIAHYGCIAALGVKVLENNSQEQVDAKVTFTIDKNTDSYGDGNTFKTVVYLSSADTVGAASFPNNNAVVFPFAEQVAAASSSASIRANGGLGGLSYNKIRIVIEPKTGATSGSTGVPVYDVYLSRLMLARCFYASIANSSINYSAIDQSDIVRSFAGVPYVLRQKIRRKISANFSSLKKHSVFGQVAGSFGTLFYSNINAVNRTVGKSRNVIFTPRLIPPSNEIGVQSTPSPTTTYIGEAWSNEHIYGLLDDTLSARLQTVRADVTDTQLWNCDFSIVETPLL
jgi:hypothetical protein